MGAEIGVILIAVIVIIVIFIALSRKPQREMTATERVAYEDERGRIIAREETRRRY